MNVTLQWIASVFLYSAATWRLKLCSTESISHGSSSTWACPFTHERTRTPAPPATAGPATTAASDSTTNATASTRARFLKTRRKCVHMCLVVVLAFLHCEEVVFMCMKLQQKWSMLCTWGSAESSILQLGFVHMEKRTLVLCRPPSWYLSLTCIQHSGHHAPFWSLICVFVRALQPSFI